MFGLLNMNKPAGWTSREVVNQVTRLVPRKVKVGHAGTLDPLATGVLVVCVGPATRLEPWIHDHLKTYDATFQLGFRSDSDDTEGSVEPVPVTTIPSLYDLQQSLPEFVGHIQQVPPVYSALRVNGKRAYTLARAGETVELASREVFVSEIQILDFTFPELRLRIECGTGTYIRSIGRDLARRVGTEAVMSALERTCIGTFSVEQAVAPEDLTKENTAGFLRNPIELLDLYPRVVVSAGDVKRLIYGQPLPWPETIPSTEGTTIVIEDEAGMLAAIGHCKGGKLWPQSVFASRE
ncbi:MAG TPA: tRNA pseudouridine(55) synthase TruB [Planctomicrobium sp.]|nr:tRNA pseudouridine(55) synthase TruB [Planctomicrobium sp.]